MKKFKKKTFIRAAKGLYPFKSKLEKIIYKIIKRQFPDQDIKINKKGIIKCNKNFELDLYFPNYNIGIEIQGPLHYANEAVILKDYEKKMSFFNEKRIRIIYIYTNTYENQKYSIKKCIDILNNEQKKRGKN